VTLKLTTQEWDALSRWAEKTIRGGHWGDGMLLLGEEEKVLKLVSEKPVEWELSPLELRVLRYWLDNNHPTTPVEKKLAEKILSLVP